MTTVPAAGLRALAMPVVVVAVEHEGRRSCSTSTAMYAALDPPTLVVSLSVHSTTARLVLAAGRFSVSALGVHQAAVAVAAGGRAHGPDKLAEVGIDAVEPDADFAQPSVAGAPMAWSCEVRAEQVVGDHTLVTAEIVAVRPGEAEAPLLRHDRRYVGLGVPTSAQDQGGYPL
jgi:flavin reductase (DIM6/NTAB) family NADH-FMN oxidoreductase RutF